MNRKSIKIANQTAAQTIPFVVLQDSWVQLSPYGDFPHGKGLQRVDRTAAETLTSNFHSFSGKLGRRFAGVPFYVGHPDVPGFENSYPDQKAYGWVMALESRDDGLYGQIKWSKAGNELLENAHYKFLSPYWEAAEIGFEKGRKVFRPQSVISVGLTNQPNIPVLPLANSENLHNADQTTILTTLGLDPSATREEILQHLAAPASTASPASTPSTPFVPSVPSVPLVPLVPLVPQNPRRPGNMISMEINPNPVGRGALTRRSSQQTRHKNTNRTRFSDNKKHDLSQ
jgi:hypothetical protein